MEVSRFFYSQLLFTTLISKFKILNFSGAFSELLTPFLLYKISDIFVVFLQA